MCNMTLVWHERYIDREIFGDRWFDFTYFTSMLFLRFGFICIAFNIITLTHSFIHISFSYYDRKRERYTSRLWLKKWRRRGKKITEYESVKSNSDRPMVSMYWYTIDDRVCLRACAFWSKNVFHSHVVYAKFSTTTHVCVTYNLVKVIIIIIIECLWCACYTIGLWEANVRFSITWNANFWYQYLCLRVRVSLSLSFSLFLSSFLLVSANGNENTKTRENWYACVSVCRQCVGCFGTRKCVFIILFLSINADTCVFILEASISKILVKVISYIVYLQCTDSFYLHLYLIFLFHYLCLCVFIVNFQVDIWTGWQVDHIFLSLALSFPPFATYTK